MSSYNIFTYTNLLSSITIIHSGSVPSSNRYLFPFNGSSSLELPLIHNDIVQLFYTSCAYTGSAHEAIFRTRDNGGGIISFTTSSVPYPYDYAAYEVYITGSNPVTGSNMLLSMGNWSGAPQKSKPISFFPEITSVTGNAYLPIIMETGSLFVNAKIKPSNLSTGTTGPNEYIPKWKNNSLTTSSIYSTGSKIGIGNSSPTSDLHIGDATSVNRKITLGAGGDAMCSSSIKFGPDTRDWEMVAGPWPNYTWHVDYVGTNAPKQNIIIAKPDGSVGIGKTNPVTLLDVSGSIRSISPSGYAGFICGTDQKQWLMYHSANDLRFFEYNWSHEVGGGNNRLTLQSGGNVGIGTTSPGQKLDIQNTVASTPLLTQIYNTSNTAGSDARLHLAVQGASSGDPYISFTNLASQNWSVGSDTSDSGKFKIAHSNTLGSAEVITVDTSNRVGIGTTAPAQKLDVSGSVKIGNAVINPTGANGYDLHITNNSGTGNIVYVASLFGTGSNSLVSATRLSCMYLMESTQTMYNPSGQWSFTVNNATTPYVFISGSGKPTASLDTAASCGNRMYTIKNISNVRSVIVANGTDKIDGASSYIISGSYKYISILSDGSRWNIIGQG